MVVPLTSTLATAPVRAITASLLRSHRSSAAEGGTLPSDMLRGAGCSADTAAARELWRRGAESWLFLESSRGFFKGVYKKSAREIRRDVAADSTFFTERHERAGGTIQGARAPIRPLSIRSRAVPTADALHDRTRRDRTGRHPFRPEPKGNPPFTRSELLLEKVTNRRHELPPQQRRSPAARRQRHRAAPASALA